MRRLILMRHAKSSWTDPLLHDAARPLNERGRGAAPRMGAWLAEQGLAPDLALVSTARRCIETWELAAPAMDEPQRASNEGIYQAGPERLLAIVNEADDGVGTLMLLGHEPGIPELLRLLAAPDAGKGLARAFGKFPTGAAAALEFDAESWASVEPGAGRLIAYAQPKDFD